MQLENLCMLRIYGIQQIRNTSRENKDLMENGDNLEEARVQRQGGSITTFSLQKEKERATESPRATQQSPCRRTHIEKKRRSKSRYPQTRKGDQRGKERNTNSGTQKPCVVAIDRIGSWRTGTPTLGAGGAPGMVLCFVLFTWFFFFWHAGKLAFEERGVKSGEEGRQVSICRCDARRELQSYQEFR